MVWPRAPKSALFVIIPFIKGVHFGTVISVVNHFIWAASRDGLKRSIILMISRKRKLLQVDS